MALRRVRGHVSPLRNLLELALLAFAILPSSLAQNIVPIDSLHIPQPDTLSGGHRPSHFLPFIGNRERSSDSTSVLHSTHFIQSDASSVADLLRRVPGVFIRELGQPGQPSQLNFDGYDDRATALLIDGRPLRDPITGTYNLSDIPIEFVDAIELGNSSSSLFAGYNSAGNAINIVSHQYDNIRPTTKLRFFQGPFDHILTDGIFTQDVSRDMNAMVGLQRLVTDGRFANSKFDSWNLRVRLRYNITDRINVWASDFYRKSTTGLNGGIDPLLSPSLFDEVTAVVRDETTAQTVSGHDFTFGFVGKLLPDSTSRTRGLFYYSQVDREYSTRSALPAVTDLQRSSYWGIKLEQQIDLSVLEINLGLEHERRSVQKGLHLGNLDESCSSAKGQLLVRPFEWLEAEGSMRYESFRGNDGLSWGSGLRTNITDWLSFKADFSRTFNYPTIHELFWADSTVVRAGSLEKETHLASGVSLRIETGILSCSLRGFKRRVENAITVRQIGVLDAPSSLAITSSPQVEVQGVAARLTLQLWRFTFDGNLTYTDYREQANSTQPFPRFSSSSELSYRAIFGDSIVDLRVAARVKAVSRHYGLLFIPRQFSFAQQSSTLMPGFSTVDFYAVAKIGDAYVTFVWENPFNVNAMMVPYYPLLGRNVKLGVNWVFTD